MVWQAALGPSAHTKLTLPGMEISIAHNFTAAIPFEESFEVRSMEWKAAPCSGLDVEGSRILSA